MNIKNDIMNLIDQLYLTIAWLGNVTVVQRDIGLELGLVKLEGALPNSNECRLIPDHMTI